MKSFFRFFLVVAVSLLYVSADAQQRKPNILLIFADDLGYMDCGFTGSKTMETPNLDALAKKGMVFDNAYAGMANCAPSRATLMSGKYTPRHGVYAVGSTTRGPVNLMRLVPVRNDTSLDSSFVTVAEALKAQGYTTGIFGKWHLGTDEKSSPTAQGFDVYVDHLNNKDRNKQTNPKAMFSLTEQAIKFMENNKDKPFFTYLAHHAIHGPQEARPATIVKFKQKGLSDRMALYAACTYDFDETVGNLMDFMKKSGLDKNTLIIFTSDNGGLPVSSQEPLRGNKGAYYEGGIREPFIAYWPNKIKSGTINSAPISNIDFYPTFTALAGKQQADVDGENIAPLLFGEKKETSRKSLYWYFPGYLDNPVNRGRDKVFRSRPVAVVRKGDFKLHLYLEEWLLDGGKASIDKNNAVELYNLKADLGEHHNIANTNKAKRDELLNDLLAWMKKTKAPLPTKITDTNKPVEGNVSGEAE